MPGLDTWTDPTSLASRGLNGKNGGGGSFTPSQNRATLIVGLTCACISLIIVFLTLRWFLLMRRLFRHRLILLLVASDSFKAIWYFVFGIVTISGRPVASHSGFCQASGYLLLVAMEASDVAILILALHTVLCVFQPNPKSGEGGLYPCRHWIIPVWLFPPILLASLAFINRDDAYVTAGTFCFLPKRPFWYRLALSWIPRYIIIVLILAMYAAIYFYVHLKFRGFKSLHASDYSKDSAFTSRRTTEATAVDAVPSERPSIVLPPTVVVAKRPGIIRGRSSNSVNGTSGAPEPSQPWDSMNFITQTPLTSPKAQTDVAPGESDAESPGTGSGSPSPPHGSRKESQATTQASFTSDTVVPQAPSDTPPLKTSDDGTRDHLQKTRAAIRKQLRFLFIYPLIYILMWAFPFANHITMYFNSFVQHPSFWLNIMSTVSLALQAGVNGLVFSIKEKPWRRISNESPFSVNFRFWKRSAQQEEQQQPQKEDKEIEGVAPATTPHWWEAEGRKRRDSVWMGTDVLTSITTRKHQRTMTLASINERSPV